MAGPSSEAPSSAVSSGMGSSGGGNAGGSVGQGQTNQRARFRVKFSDVLLVFPGGGPKEPSSLTFTFDSFWTGETSIEPDAGRPSAGASGSPPDEKRFQLAFRSYSNNAGKKKVLDAPESEPRFMYETSLASKLHRKFLVLTLRLESSSHTPTAIISIDSLARGCQRIALTFSDPADPSAAPLATAHFRVSMLHFERVQAILSDVKVADYPEKYMHDVKMLFIEMGARPSPDGPVNPTEKSSDAEPRFNKLPTLEKVCSLQEMLHGGAAPSDLRIFFQLHRQVARTRTEQIGLGALPVHMLFSKVVNGRMEEPTKFKVPLAGYKGVVKGKILVRNIPQWSQLGGDDLVNRDGCITPASVDLNTRKLLPWMKLPRSVSSARRPNAPSPSIRAYASPSTQAMPHVMQLAPSMVHQGHQYQPGYMPMMPSLPPSLQSTPDISAPLPPPEFPAVGVASGTGMGPGPQMHLPLPPSAKWPEGGMHLPPALQAPTPPSALPPTAHFGQSTTRVNDHFRRPSADFFNDVSSAFSATPAGVGPAKSSGAPGASGTSGAPVSPEQGGTELDSLEQEQEQQREYQRQREEYQRSTYYAMDHVAQAPPSAMYLPYVNLDGDQGTAPEPPPEPPAELPVGQVGGGKSTKSFGSSTTGYEGANSDVQDPQYGSDDGLVPTPQEPVVEEWIAVQDTHSECFYFANSITNESLWLPPGWEQRLDGDGRPFFVDHENQSTQREFPAEEARRYKERVESGTG